MLVENAVLWEREVNYTRLLAGLDHVATLSGHK